MKTFDGQLIKLSMVDNSSFISLINPILVDGEEIVNSFKAGRDGVIFTNKRVIATDTQGITGKKKEICSLPYSKIIAFSSENAGFMDRDSELEIWFNTIGKVVFEFDKNTDTGAICKLIAKYALS